MKKFFENLFSSCDHKWHDEGWSYIVCDKCGKVRHDPDMNAKLKSEFFQDVAKNNPNAPEWIKTFIK